MFSLTLNSFADFKEKNIRLFTDSRELIYRNFRERKIVSKIQLIESIQDFIDEPWDVPLKKMENNEFVANIFWYMYAHKIFLTDFSEEEVIKELKIFMTEAIKEGSEDVLDILYRITETSLAVCIKAMQLMLTNDLYDYIRLCRICEQWFKGRYEKVLKDILGRDDIVILRSYPKNLRFAPSPVKLEFNTVTLGRLKKFLKDKCQGDDFYEVIELLLEDWYNRCEKIEIICKKPYKGLGIGGFSMFL